MSELYERIDQLCKSRNINITTMCKEAGVSRSSLTDLKSGRKQKLSVDTLSKIASYFDISVDYLAGYKTKKAPAETGKRSNDSDILDEVDIAFYGDYKELTEENKETLRAMARLFRERQGKQE